MKTIINNWEYCIDEMILKPTLIIRPDIEKKKPLTLSKYYAFNRNNIHAFVNSQLFACQPEYFNDLFDSNFLLTDFSKIPYEMVKDLFTGKDSIIMENQYKADPPSFMYRFRNSTYSNWNEQNGISCFTNNKLSELMWAHYSSNAGFLVEYNYLKFPDNIKGPYPINYLQNLIPIDASITNPILAILSSQMLKKSIWSYEDEYRFIIYPQKADFFLTTGRFPNVDDLDKSKESRLVKHPKDLIERVILGFNFFKDEIVEKGNPNVIHIVSENAINKCFFLDHLIENKLAVENIFWKNFEFTSKQIEINKLESTIYQIKNLW